MPYLTKGDIILDAGNEHWTNTERRQGICYTKGIRYIGVGVSGGYQAARDGMSLCPGADDESLDLILPLLQKIAAKNDKGEPAVTKAGLGGAGHYVKMIHNGIEHGMMSAIAEAWQIMNVGLGMSYDQIAKEMDRWNSKGQLRGTFLIRIGADICRTKDKDGHSVLADVEDKVVQDITGEEGTGIWSNEEAIAKHIPAPTLNAAHAFRLASADRGQRIRAKQAMDGNYPPRPLSNVNNKAIFVEELRVATYLSCLTSFIQGFNIIERADREYKWNIDYANVLQIWSAGCIIQADYIRDLFEPIMQNYKKKDTINLLFEESIARELKDGLPMLRSVVSLCAQKDHIIPALSASLEYIKYQTNTALPASFYEAELDYFGKHMFDKKGEAGTEAPTEGKHHYEWKPT